MLQAHPFGQTEGLFPRVPLTSNSPLCKYLKAASPLFPSILKKDSSWRSFEFWVIGQHEGLARWTRWLFSDYGAWRHLLPNTNFLLSELLCCSGLFLLSRSTLMLPCNVNLHFILIYPPTGPIYPQKHLGSLLWSGIILKSIWVL